MKLLFVLTVTLASEDGDDPILWLSFNYNYLTIEDRDTIMKGDCLNDKHINLAQEILKHQLGHLSGLESTLYLHKLKVPLPATNSLQIIHSQDRSHWIVASTIGCFYNEVMVFDSLFTSIDETTLAVIAQIFGTHMNATIQTSPRQHGYTDYGIFANAVCTSLAHGTDIYQSQGLMYDQSAIQLF